MISPEIRKSLNGATHEIVIACNIVISRKTVDPGGAEHEKAMERLTQVLTNKSNALDALKALQKGE